MTHTRFSQILAALTIAFAAFLYFASTSDARAVALTDATSPPAELAYLYPGAHITYARSVPDGVSNCPGPEEVGRFFTDVSAYRWNGHALGAQRWTDHNTLMYWRYGRGRVTFDGITFRNHSAHPVLVAGWCE